MTRKATVLDLRPRLEQKKRLEKREAKSLARYKMLGASIFLASAALTIGGTTLGLRALFRHANTVIVQHRNTEPNPQFNALCDKEKRHLIEAMISSPPRPNRADSFQLDCL